MNDPVQRIATQFAAEFVLSFGRCNPREITLDTKGNVFNGNMPVDHIEAMRITVCATLLMAVVGGRDDILDDFNSMETNPLYRPAFTWVCKHLHENDPLQVLGAFHEAITA